MRAPLNDEASLKAFSAEAYDEVEAVLEKYCVPFTTGDMAKAVPGMGVFTGFGLAAADKAIDPQEVGCELRRKAYIKAAKDVVLGLLAYAKAKGITSPFITLYYQPGNKAAKVWEHVEVALFPEVLKVMVGFYAEVTQDEDDEQARAA